MSIMELMGSQTVFVANVLLILIFAGFYMAVDNFSFLWDYGLAKKTTINRKTFIHRLYLSLFTQMGHPPEGVAPYGAWSYALIILQGMLSLFVNKINLPSLLGGAAVAGAGADGAVGV